MRRIVDVVVLLAPIALLAAFVRGYAPTEAAPARPAGIVHGPMPILDRPMTRFDLLFGEPELARP
jgi:hypothetical protein